VVTQYRLLDLGRSALVVGTLQQKQNHLVHLGLTQLLITGARGAFYQASNGFGNDGQTAHQASHYHVDMLKGTIVAVGIHFDSSALGNVGTNVPRVFPIRLIGTKRRAGFGISEREQGRQAHAGEEVHIVGPEVCRGKGFGGLG
jgi:hypothetical protein